LRMAGERILIVDDEERIRDIIREYASLEGYQADEAADGAAALRLFRAQEYALVILDIMMPGMDGWGVCREIRKSSAVPIIMLSARGEEYDKIFGFELGVDDYLTKPFSPRELMARARAVIRRSQPKPMPESAGDRVRFGGLTIDFQARNVLVDGKAVSLTPKEYELLSFFARHPQQVFSREQLLSSVWGYDYLGDDRTVDSHVKMLRTALGEYRSLIVTVWGTGYKFVPGGGK